MAGFILRRLLQLVPMLLGASLLIFAVIRLAPGDPYSGLVDPRADPAKIEELRRRHCLDCPLPQQYWRWLSHAARGDLGTSIRFRIPVAQLIGDRLGPSIALGVTAQSIVLLAGIPFGILAAVRRGTWVDAAVTTCSLAFLAIPAFFLGLLLLRFFSLGGLQVLPSAGFTTPGSLLTGPARFLDAARHLILPATALGVTGIAGLMSHVRSAMLEVLRQDYLRTARAKGLPERMVIYRHALRNALMPVITLLGLNLPALLGGAIITESLFQWPGVGRLTYTALLERDYPVLMALNLLFAALTLLGSLLADVGYAAVDPRVRYE
ncbi:ABC transporter permease [Symbiobacterium thermophilum]|uniref:Oligopeptide ABC transporter permease protein n=2 Tax=Symbiobacterium thermophilum TaxID=2734 RepID=Q67KR8_SYMTH|nr:ABC transporter permease [Symbiobacterium thermophilum]MBY6277602.1 ABC transporter permease [Symbiobacterium thermophilum]BAD41729.1 oligopeptide ABC transporter permease protein [Symbiobacterium thermophilum IAM 14863]